ncbi:DUF3090 domain-containing protein [Frankia sp. QA3]|uniref:DUF3090 domain-containing protein n=1 Tax=Frankia sp. QA3 TaxID=710111 RepID=UPI000269BD88|nr:DUF3090 domain-containing protein [Frankia sp. QA3]EIV91375.1 hypothetical protein FraQA3DRAFT_0820 [Frankia sp. QA3]
MARRIHVFDPPQRFVAGTVGSPGARVFYLQARTDARLVTVAVEKTQVALLAEQLTELLDELGRRGVAIGSADPAAAPDTSPLEQPIEAEFRVATIALGWDPRGSRVVVEAQAAGGDESVPGFSDDPDGPDALRVLLQAGPARAFARRAGLLVAAGRPACPLCGLPLDDGHVCPRQNGHRH